MRVSLFSFTIWFFPIIFFAFQFILRLFPGLVMPELMAHYQVNSAEFGWLASMYYLGYAGMQIPVAILLDSFKVRWILFSCVMLCGVGAYLTAISTNWNIALFSRFIIGIGSAAGFLGVSKVIAQWFPAHWYARMVGFSFTLGLIGAIFGGKPISLIINLYGWQHALQWLSFISVGIAIAILLMVKQPKSYNKLNLNSNEKISWSSFKSLLSQPGLISLAVANLLMVGSLEGFADLWGVPYFISTHNISIPEAASLTSTIFFGMIFGGPLLGFIAEKYQCHFMLIKLCALFMALIFISMLFYGSKLPIEVIRICMFFIGIFCCYQVIIFAVGAKMVSVKLISISVAFLNSINMLGGTFFHSSIGFLMNFQNSATTLNNLDHSVSSPKNFIIALSVIPISSLVGILLINKAQKKSIKNMRV